MSNLEITKSFEENTLELFKKTEILPKNTNLHLLTLHNISEKELLNLHEKSKKSKVHVLVFCFECMWFDPEHNISKQLLLFSDLLKKYYIFNCNFYFTSFWSNQIVETFKYLNTNFYDWTFYNFDIDFPYSYKFQTLKNVDIANQELFLENCKMKFSHLNFTHKMHRKLFSKFLLKENLTKNNLVSINFPRDNSKFFTNSIIDTQTKDNWFYNKNLLELWKEVELTYQKHPYIPDNFDSPYLECLHYSAINIVSESVFDYPFQLFTEKIISSLLSKRPFILIGPHNSLKYLKDKGFKTFDTIFDESYDQVSDPNKRLETIMQLVLNLNKKTQDELNEMVYAIKDTLMHNYKLMLNKFRVFTNV